MASETPPTEKWADAVTAAAEHVVARAEAAEESAARQKPKAQGPKVFAAILVLTAVIAVDVWLWTRPPEAPPAEAETSQLVWFVADAVETIEDYRSAEGDLPGAADVADLLSDDVTYERRSDGYAVTVRGETASLTFDGSLTLEEWLRVHAAPPVSSEAR